MGMRKDAAWRVIAFLWQSTVGWVPSVIVLTIALPVALLDVLWQAIFGREGFSPNGMVFKWVSLFIMWNADQLNYSLTGDGMFHAIPTSPR